MLYYVVSMCHACCLLLVLLGRFEDFEVPSSKVSVNFIVRIERFLEDCWLAVVAAVVMVPGVTVLLFVTVLAESRVECWHKCTVQFGTTSSLAQCCQKIRYELRNFAANIRNSEMNV